MHYRRNRSNIDDKMVLVINKLLILIELVLIHFQNLLSQINFGQF